MRQRNIDLETRLADCRQTESETRYRRIFESAKDGILILDADSGLIMDLNPSLTEMLGFSKGEFLGARLSEITPFKDNKSSTDTLDELRRSGSVRLTDLSLDTKSGQRLEVEFVANVYVVDNKKVIQCNLHDITERKRAEERLEYLSTHDALTGLHNRIFFDEEMSRLSRGRQFPITFIVVDIDGLKKINDRLGHAGGDELLRRAAAVLKETFRADEVVARLGGDEFVVLLPNTDEATAEMVLERVRNKLDSHNSAQTGPALSLSLGASTAKASKSMVDALKQADERMYREKVVHKQQGPESIQHDPQFIFKHIEAKLSASPGTHISILASELACERHLIERAVKVVKSMQFREYQQIRKLELALHLLTERPLLVKEIAGTLGYSSPKSLWRLLRTRIGEGPSNIRTLTKVTSAAQATNVTHYSTLATHEPLKSNPPKV